MVYYCPFVQHLAYTHFSATWFTDSAFHNF